MTAREALAAVRQLGGNLSLANGRIRLDAPAGVMTPELREALAANKPELAEILETERRQTEVARAISDAYDRLNCLGPWTPPEACAHAALGVAVDTAGRAYIQGDGGLSALAGAIRRWEGALSAGRTPKPTGCPCGSVVVREEEDGAKFCGRCARRLNPEPVQATDDGLTWGVQ